MASVCRDRGDETQHVGENCNYFFQCHKGECCLTAKLKKPLVSMVYTKIVST